MTVFLPPPRSTRAASRDSHLVFIGRCYHAYLMFCQRMTMCKILRFITECRTARARLQPRFANSSLCNGLSRHCAERVLLAISCETAVSTHFNLVATLRPALKTNSGQLNARSWLADKPCLDIAVLNSMGWPIPMTGEPASLRRDCRRAASYTRADQHPERGRPISTRSGEIRMTCHGLLTCRCRSLPHTYTACGGFSSDLAADCVIPLHAIVLPATY
jgi:hypothetical protein